jgi:hypothetical protein
MFYELDTKPYIYIYILKREGGGEVTKNLYIKPRNIFLSLATSESCN